MLLDPGCPLEFLLCSRWFRVSEALGEVPPGRLWPRNHQWEDMCSEGRQEGSQQVGSCLQPREPPEKEGKT